MNSAVLFQGWITLTVKKLFLMFKWNFLYFDLCTFLVVLSLGSSEKNPASSSIHPPVRCLCTLTRCPLSFLQAEQPQLFQQPVIWQMQQLIIFMVFHWNHSSIAMSLFLVLESPELDVAFQVWPYQCCVEEKDYLFWPSGNSLLPWPRMVLGHTGCCQGTLLLSLAIRIPRSISSEQHCWGCTLSYHQGI